MDRLPRRETDLSDDQDNEYAYRAFAREHSLKPRAFYAIASSCHGPRPFERGVSSGSTDLSPPGLKLVQSNGKDRAEREASGDWLPVDP